MRIAILANVPAWTLPGLEHLRHNRHYATWLEPLIPAFADVARDKGLDVHWITFCQESRSDLIHRAHGQTFHILSRRSMGAQMVSAYLTEILRTRRLLANLKPDLVHAWGSEDVYGLAAAFSGFKNRIFTLQGSLTEYLRLLGGNWLFRIQAFYERPTVKRYRIATAESPAAAALLRVLNPSLDIALVDYGVNPAFFEALWNPSDQPEVLFIGSISKRKGIADLIAIARRPELAHVKFKIAGEGELRSPLESEAPPNVKWLGKCARPEVIQFLESAWALVIPTYADTGPTVVKEARVVGLPVITTTAAGASSYVTDTGCGVVTQPGDLDAFAGAILQVCQSRQECRRLGEVAWDAHRELLHPKTTARKLTELYHAVANP